jgi:predicted RNase H-like nuclease (RuvC/YqgF family)
MEKYNQTGEGIEHNSQDLKMEIESIKKSQMEVTLELENLGKRPDTRDASITNRIQEMEERISGTEYTIEDIDTLVNRFSPSLDFTVCLGVWHMYCLERGP